MMEYFAKGIIPGCKCPTRNFAGQMGRRFVELEHFDKHFAKNARKKDSAGKHFGVFLLDTLKTTVLRRKDNQAMKFGQLIEYPKSGGETSRRPFSEKPNLSISPDQ